MSGATFKLLNKHFKVGFNTQIFRILSADTFWHCSQRSGGLGQAGLPLPLARAQNLQIGTNFQASYCPACAKPLVSSSGFPHRFSVQFNHYLSIYVFFKYRHLVWSACVSPKQANGVSHWLAVRWARWCFALACALATLPCP